MHKLCTTPLLKGDAQTIEAYAGSFSAAVILIQSIISVNTFGKRS